VRELHGNFLPMIQKKAAALPVEQGLRVIQSFEHETVQVGEQEYGASTFVSEISTSPAFGAYMSIKRMTEQGKAQSEIVAALMEKFGERHPDVGIFAS
jgi:hypothetical protein